MIILFTGDRNWTNRGIVALIMLNLYHEFKMYEVVHGWARGLDSLVDDVAMEMKLPVHREPAHWRHNEPKCMEVYGPCPSDCRELVGRPAGMIRNHKMFDKWKPNLVIGFHNNLAESKGTAGMIKYAQKKNCFTHVFTEENYVEVSRVLDDFRADGTSLFVLE